MSTINNNSAGADKEYHLSPILHIVISIIPFIVVAVFFYFLFYTDIATFNKFLRKENHPVELITFIFLLAAAIAGFIFSYDLWKSKDKLVSIFYFIFAFGLFFVAMEEISWGQWFFKFHTPEYLKRVNFQNEFNVHNIEPVFLSFQILLVLFGIGGIVSVFLAKYNNFKYLSSPLSLASWYVIILIFSFINLYKWIDSSITFIPTWIGTMFTEPLEMLVSISAFLFIWINLNKFRKSTKFT